MEIDTEAVEKAMARVAVVTAPAPETLPDSVKILFSFLAHTPPERLVETKPHADGSWRMDEIYLLGDCIAVQFAEGHYMETIFFVRNPAGWRVAGRIRPKDHL